MSFGYVRWNNMFHVFALRTQGDKVVDRKVLKEDLPSEAQAYDEMRLQADFHFMAGRDVFR